jgi:hypothetical protein
MKFPTLLMLLALMATPAWADQRDIDSDPSTDFSAYHTFLIRPGQITARAPELNSPIMRKKIEEELRTQLTAKQLTEVSSQPDLVVVWRFGSVNKREVQTWATGRWGRGRAWSTYRFTEGTLVVDLYERGDRTLVWRGIYRDDENNPSKLSNRLDVDIKKLFKDFPPKKKK